MSKPNEQHREQDELELDAETIKDLEPDQTATEGVQGGLAINTNCTAAISGC
jgi:hypothetical protein